MWPFSEMSLSAATLVGTIANWILLACLLGGVIATFVIVKTTDVKEEHWDTARKQSTERIAELSTKGDEARAAIAAAQAEVARANESAAQANERAALVQSQVVARFINPQQEKCLLEKLTGSGLRILVRFQPIDESIKYAGALRKVFEKAGVSHGWQSGEIAPIITGLLVSDSDPSYLKLRTILEECGVPFDHRPTPWMSIPRHAGDENPAQPAGPPKRPPDGVILIYVANKPSSVMPESLPARQ
jgi:outer membrane murein-binding lipoprotein Lpp